MLDLTLAGNYLRQHGWHQGSLTGASGAVCVAGAIIEVAPALDADLVEAFTLVGRRIGLSEDQLRPSVIVSHIAAWNDAPDRTLYDVLDILEPETEHMGDGAESELNDGNLLLAIGCG
jgi:hypothetical protein